MSVEELKAVVDNATEEERLFLAAYLRIKRDGGSGPLGVALAQANESLLRGEGVRLEELKKLLAQSDDSGS
jgi:hypothetical protein